MCSVEKEYSTWKCSNLLLCAHVSCVLAKIRFRLVATSQAGKGHQAAAQGKSGPGTSFPLLAHCTYSGSGSRHWLPGVACIHHTSCDNWQGIEIQWLSLNIETEFCHIWEDAESLLVALRAFHGNSTAVHCGQRYAVESQEWCSVFCKEVNTKGDDGCWKLSFQ